ncbi:MAG: hypothetical protein N2259_01225, partial [Patescibacteria group bacterium]|nr:hypothetical protein [Patescibacteria group bacterium]
MKGYIALITILVFTAVGLAVAISSGLLGIGGGQLSLDALEKQKASALATLCAEDVLERLRENINLDQWPNIPLCRQFTNQTDCVNFCGQFNNQSNCQNNGCYWENNYCYGYHSCQWD